MNTLGLYYRDEPPSPCPVEEGGWGPNPWAKPSFHALGGECTFREAVDATREYLAQDIAGWFFRARQLTEMSTRHEIREVTGIRMKLQRAALVRARLYLRDPDLASLASRALFSVYFYGTPAYGRYDRFRRRVVETTMKRKEWIASHEASPERQDAKRARREDEGVKTERREKEGDPYRRYSEAVRKRLRYYGVTDPSKLPSKSARGRKPKTSIRVVGAGL